MLRDVLSNNLKVVFCGTAKGEVSAKLGFYYAGPGNQFYPILFKSGLTDKLLLPHECYEISNYKVGLTDLVHAQSGNDDIIDDESYDLIGFLEKIAKYKPKYIGFNGKKAASYALGFNGRTKKVKYGLQEQKIHDSIVFVLPSTSGSARKYWDESYWFELANMVTRTFA